MFFLPTGGGEAEKKTDVPGGRGQLQVHPRRQAPPPDRRGVARVRRRRGLQPEEGRGDGEGEAEGVRRRPPPLPPLDSWKDGKRTHILLVDLADPKATLRDLTPGDFDSPVFSVGGGGRLRRLPRRQGARLHLEARRRRRPRSTNVDLWTVAIDGSPEALAAPRTSPPRTAPADGDAALLARRPLHRLPHADAARLRVGPLPAGAPRPRDGHDRASSPRASTTG